MSFLAKTLKRFSFQSLLKLPNSIPVFARHSTALTNCSIARARIGVACERKACALKAASTQSLEWLGVIAAEGFSETENVLATS
jgi:hypothetical protein